MDWRHITSVFILGIIGIIFVYDAFVDAVGQHATISEETTSFIYHHPLVYALFFICIGILIGHLLFSVNYQ